ncbi:ATP-binding protein [Aquirhabdus parva]|uniref:ATP-binding protein n=1 Tax=Aquirhabdus parva TaxID=2283318 RepID=A0A345P7K9_9GAMM|nr:ATP-binding protein [Aquirhabdus parva]AXI03268.1 ATP-binding protein [Aquirhabdus parva]
MRFQIVNKDVKNRGDFKILELSKYVSNDDNIFTLLVGKNSSGKSRLLASVITDFKKSADRYQYYPPSKIIAISTGANDKFPRVSDINTSYLFYSPRNKIDRAKRPLSTRNPLFKTDFLHLERIFDYIALEDYFVRYNFKAISGILSHLGLTENFNVSYNINSVVFDQYFDEIYGSKTSEEIDSSSSFFYEPAKLKDVPRNIRVEFIEFFLTRDKNFSVNIESRHGFSSFLRSTKDLFIYLVEINVLRISKISFYEKKTKSRIGLADLSSGQISFLGIFLTLAVFLENNALVCIDEPEISFHPEWQLDFMYVLQKYFSHYKGCHFIIATHSPQIVSGLRNDNGFILDLETDILHRADSYKCSADVQLAEVFGYPGYNNEYLIRLAMNYIAMIIDDKFVSFEEEEKEKIRMLFKLVDNLDASDTAAVLIKQMGNFMAVKEVPL